MMLLLIYAGFTGISIAGDQLSAADVKTLDFGANIFLAVHRY
ncbi:hypothetical protein RNAN_1016 [Rheinheimera nanhaiensis E407-8]|uniref:Uncharacterized protein n=1 Tax=Rheinheimera nanhaiensis E407-8 TaxID=562729 RepID=I1DVG7_9GAMM|nr:hypothetical protein RNAN_1016 [Rheinheimera nanhaiensis E407-8]